MLEILKIKNIAVIDEAEIPFRQGLNILSGETGAGKSIVLSAISLLLGGRANAELVRSGCEEAVIEGLFEVSDIPWVRERLQRFGFAAEGRELLIKRIVSRGGRHRIYVNGEMATLSILQELCEGLIDLCGQHEHQSLLRPKTQLDLLDRFGGLSDQANQLSQLFSGARSVRAELERVESMAKESSTRKDFLKFQIQELVEARLQSGEDETLQEEKKLLQSAEQRLQVAQSALDGLESESKDELPGVLDILRVVVSKLRSLQTLDAQAEPMVSGLERCIAEAQEVVAVLSRYVSACDRDPERLEQIQERLSLLVDLRRKYGASVPEMLASLEKFESEFRDLEDSGSKIKELQQAVSSAEVELKKLGEKLSSARKKVSKLLSDSVTAELQELKMEDAQFEIRLIQKKDLSEWTLAAGADSIEFFISTNRGEPGRTIGKIASGGELSRIMLAIRRVIADRGGIGVYLFDEIDAGIGGQTAIEVGKKLKSVAQYNQVICITHLPQVASFADHHLTVRKTTKGDRTLTQVVELKGEEKKKELSRMMGGPKMTKILESSS